jgi:serine/threonine-protein kinase
MGADPRKQLAPGLEVTKSVRLLEPLGKGGMGAVWLAEHLALKTKVVVKFMSPELAASEAAVARFGREAAAAAQVKSPHVVQMLDHGVTDDNIPFIVMEHLEGHDLSTQLAKHGPLPPEEVAVIVTQVAKALGKAHSAGILHRDIKPENIFLTEIEGERFVKLLDFGIAKSTENQLDSETKTGQVVGTPFYMSPEQITGVKNLDAGADLWSLGVVAFEAVTGQRPFRGETIGGLAVAIVSGATPVPSQVWPGLPPAFDEWFARACSRDVTKRFQTAREMADALNAVFRGTAIAPLSGSDPEISRPSFVNAPTVASMPKPPVAMASTGEAGSVGVSIKPGAGKPGKKRTMTWALVLATLLGGVTAVAFIKLYGNSSAATGGPVASATIPSASASATPPATVSVSTLVSATASAVPSPSPSPSPSPVQTTPATTKKHIPTATASASSTPAPPASTPSPAPSSSVPQKRDVL